MEPTGRYARLEPLSSAHIAPLSEMSVERSLWYSMSFADLSTPDVLRAGVMQAQTEPDRGVGLPFAIIDLAAGIATRRRYLTIAYCIR